MPKANDTRLKRGNLANRPAVLRDVMCKERRWFMQTGPRGEHIHVDQDITGDEHAITFAPQGNMTAGVSRCFDHEKVADHVPVAQGTVDGMPRPGPYLLLQSGDRVSRVAYSPVTWPLWARGTSGAPHQSGRR